MKNAMIEANETIEEERAFELAQRKAKVYASSTLVPKEYQNNIGNVLIAMNMAKRMNADPLMVMQNLYIVHGKPGWSAQFLVACQNSCGRFSAIKYRFAGERGKSSWSCTAYTTELSSGDLVEGPTVSIDMAAAEGWSTKAGSKWKTMPELMLRYRSAAFLIRCTAPEIGMGIMTADEVEDTYTSRTERTATETVLGSIVKPLIEQRTENDYDALLNKATSVKKLDELAQVVVEDKSLPEERRDGLLAEVDSRLDFLSQEPDGV